MQLSKLFNFDENSIFTDHALHDAQFSGPSSSPKREQAANEAMTHAEGILRREDNSNEMRYFQQFKKIYNVSYHLHLQKLRLADLHSQLARKINAIDERLQNKEEKEAKRTEVSSEENKMKRARRTAEMIEKKFKCEVAFCERFYGSEGSLQQHIKLKHPELYRCSDDCSRPPTSEFNDSI